ncbi:MAG: sulfotransferase [Gammaproteobacteria bacterium]|nr:sulfotransferase [Gammaproteobacteria bacterium]
MALTLNAGDVLANLALSQLLIRKGQGREAVTVLERLLTRSDLTPTNRAVAFSRLGAALEELGDYGRAFQAFRESNEVLLDSSGEATKTGLYSLKSANRIDRHRKALLSLPRTRITEEEPVFLVGFPRSGTTLLDQILSSHPRIVVIEEQDNLKDFLTDFAASDEALERFTAAGSAELASCRERYRALVSRSAPSAGTERILVDKYPLNTIFMALIARLFPGACFIFVVRDPRDVVLSCFKHSFALNAAMNNFLTLESTVRYYTAVMGIGIAALPLLGGRAYALRYENLVEGLERETRKLCEFLQLDWNPAMLRFQDAARRRHLNTPSYHQVVRPLYKSARGRWRGYEAYLQPYLAQLQPFIERFGYH